MNQLRKKFIFFFFFNDTATTEIYTLSLHDALPISYKTHSSVLSVNHRNKAMMTTKPKTYKVICMVSLRVGQTTFLTSRQASRSEEHTSELQSQSNLVCRLLLEKKKKINEYNHLPYR